MKASINAVKKFISDYEFNNDVSEEYKKGFYDFGNALIYSLESLDKFFYESDKETEWISADILPPNDENVLVWFEYYRYGSYNRLYQTMGISNAFRGKWSNFVNDESGWQQLKIIAWQPLPEPPQMEGVKIG